jgi:hypothetical protein
MASAPLELDAVLERLADANQLVRVRRLGQEYLVHSAQRPCDRIDALMADLCAILKRHGDYAESNERLRQLLDEAGIEFTDDELDRALQQGEFSGR